MVIDILPVTSSEYPDQSTGEVTDDIAPGVHQSPCTYCETIQYHRSLYFPPILPWLTPLKYSQRKTSTPCSQTQVVWKTWLMRRWSILTGRWIPLAPRWRTTTAPCCSTPSAKCLPLLTRTTLAVRARAAARVVGAAPQAAAICLDRLLRLSRLPAVLVTLLSTTSVAARPPTPRQLDIRDLPCINWSFSTNTVV
ncbi:hypothetical protein Pdw03_7428 [Penicillium digitatum]|uniref:Uncharacterized protein n=1 Tax=Penicillium digitatum TaxID=36651 RepID=A0A7T6XLX0_PENDI|nr:hypothetical protein Pdw03_7428 [Penicillium digitatum]